MSFFDSVLSGTNSTMGLEIDSDPKVKHEPFALKVKHSVGGASVSHDFRVVRDMKKDTHSQKHVTKVSKKVNDSTSVEVERSLKDLKISADHTPESMQSDKMSLDVHVEGKVEYGSRKWDSEVSSQIALKDLLPLGTFIDLGVSLNSEGAQTLKHALNFKHGDHHLGYRLEHDGQDLSAFWLQLCGNMSKDQWYFRYDHLAQKVSGGCSYKLKEHAHSNDLSYDLSGKTQGLMGQPVQWRWGGKYKLQEGIDLHSKLNVLQTCDLENIWRIKLNDKVTLVGTENVDMCKVLSDPAGAMGRVGVTFEVKI